MFVTKSSNGRPHFDCYSFSIHIQFIRQKFVTEGFSLPLYTFSDIQLCDIFVVFVFCLDKRICCVLSISSFILILLFWVELLARLSLDMYPQFVAVLVIPLTIITVEKQTKLPKHFPNYNIDKDVFI